MKQKTFSDLTKHSIRASLLFLILLLFETNHSALYAQDTDFWFVAPQLSNSFYSPVFFSISNGTAMEAHVTITLYNGGSIETINRTIPAASSSKIDFISDVAMAKVQNPRALAGAVTQYGIHITSDVKVFAYYMINSSDSRDIYTLKGKQAVGTDFFVPIGPDGVKFINQITYTDAFDQIDIVATNDNTQVTVTPTAPVYIAATATPPAAAYTSPAGTPIVR
ncbi:MAG: hypothetical protein LBN18_04385, partial [Dysgonamonadaceae bacterium]|nr:hypothetical protein [Dysgonamonadaceae bacterium]